MTPAAKEYMDKARQCLAKANINLQTELGDEAGRNAYLAGFHAARAYIANKTGKNSKTHSGVRSEFARLVKDDPHFDKEFVSFLGWAYDLKTAADYLSGSDSFVPPERAAEAIATATRFVDCIEAILKDGEKT